jgi:chromosome segregation ATPase
LDQKEKPPAMTGQPPPLTRVDLDRAVEAIVANLSDLRTEINRRFDHFDRRFDATDRRLERVELNLAAIDLKTAGMSKSLTDAERLDSAITATQSAQQRAIDDLYAKLAELARQVRPPQ